jgi:urea transporter
MNNTISGLLITVGMFVASPYYALCMLLGTSFGTLGGYLFCLDKTALANGIYGFNGTLVGVGISLFQFGGDNAFTLMPQVIFGISIQSILSTALTAGLGNLFVNKFGISPFTIPFILATWIWLLGASGSYGYFPVNGQLL